jgi:glycosyltransferase involved in cell wall biosynthesis
VGLYGQEARKKSQEIRPGNFSRIISRYSNSNFLRLALDFCINLLLNPRLLSDSLSLLTRSGNRKVDILRLFQVAKIVKFNPDIIHIQWALHLQEVTRLLLHPTRFKIVVSLRGKQINVTPVINKEVATFYEHWFTKVAAVHAVSQAIAAKTLQYGVVPERIHVIYSGVPEIFLQAFRKDDVFARAPLKILSVGRFHWVKGYGYAIDAMKILKSMNVSFHYTIIAQGEIPDEIIHQIHTYKLKDYVSIVKGIPYSKMIGEMKSHSVFLLPSLEEGIANVVLEAMAIGLPVLSTNCGGMQEVVMPGETGLLVSRRDAMSIANAIIVFQQMSDQDVHHLRKNAWEKVKADFSQPQQIQKFIELYQSLS